MPRSISVLKNYSNQVIERITFIYKYITLTFMSIIIRLYVLFWGENSDFMFFNFLLEQLYSIVLVSATQQGESAICIHIPLFFGFLPHLGHHRALSRVHSATPQILISYLFYSVCIQFQSPKVIENSNYLTMIFLR